MRYRSEIGFLLLLLALVGVAWWGHKGQPPAQSPGQPSSLTDLSAVTAFNFNLAESDGYFAKAVTAAGAVGRFYHERTVTPIVPGQDQSVVRMNRDTLYSQAVFDLDAAPVTITLPNTNGRFQSLQVISEEQYTHKVLYAPASYTIERNDLGTRYAYVIVRTFTNANDPADVLLANQAQDQISLQQSSPGHFEIPAWDPATLDRARDALNRLGSLGVPNGKVMFGTPAEVDPIAHLIGSAIGWGGNPPQAAIYASLYPQENSGNLDYQMVFRDVPIEQGGFWSVSVYNAQGFFVYNSKNAYSINSVTGVKSADGSVVVRFGQCTNNPENCIITPQGWNYTLRFYKPKAELVEGKWTYPELVPAQ